MKKAPSYWWDFEGDDMIIVESDSDRYPVVAIFKYDPDGGYPANEDAKALGITGTIGAAEEAIEQAERYIADLDARRVAPKAVKGINKP